jgi:phospho-N-acetylmuramoyl-pentapeptide-transferase
MFYLLHEWLREHVSSGLNVLRYVPFRAIAAVVTSLMITWLLYPWFIRVLRYRQIGQTIREDGPQDHFKKAGTPTMGGALMIVAILVSVALWADLRNVYVLMTMAITAGYAVLGFMDDWLKLVRGGGRGVRGKTKLFWQFGLALGTMALFFYVLAPEVGYASRVYFPYLRIDRYYTDIPEWAYLVFASIVIVGASNAVNLTDGLDGLAIFPTISSSGVFMIFAYLSGGTLVKAKLVKYLLLPVIPGAEELTVVLSAVIGAGLGFLWYNAYPASIFMGDVGALALGGLLGCVAVFTKNEFLSVIILGVFVLEAVSVITQTVSYKLTGKRVFRMAPIHHHFELKGYPEPKIITRFWIISILLGLVALASIKVR